jgi:hypothetical protein
MPKTIYKDVWRSTSIFFLGNQIFRECLKVAIPFRRGKRFHQLNFLDGSFEMTIDFLSASTPFSERPNPGRKGLTSPKRVNCLSTPFLW